MHNIFNQFFVFWLLTFAKFIYFKTIKSSYKMVTQDIKSGLPKKGSYQALTAGIFPGGMPSF